MTEADVTIDPAINTGEVKDSPIALGIAAGRGEPFPYRLRFPIEGRPIKECPVATFWLHPYTLRVAARLRDKGINPNPAIDDMGELARQNRELSQDLIDKGKGWSSLHRYDGSEWKYQPCSKDADGTDADPRVQISEIGAIFGLLKARCISAAVTVANITEGNSAGSSVPSTDEKDEPNERHNVSPEN